MLFQKSTETQNILWQHLNSGYHMSMQVTQSLGPFPNNYFRMWLNSILNYVSEETDFLSDWGYLLCFTIT